MAETAVSPPANTGTPAAPASSTPSSPSAAPAAAVPSSSAPSTPTTPTTPQAAKPDSPAGLLTKQDVKAGMMEAAKAALQKTRAGKPSAQGIPQSGNGSVAPISTPGAAANGSLSGEIAEAARPADAASAPNGSDPASGDQPDSGADPNADDETKPPPFNEHPRWKKLTRDFEAATAQVKALAPRAQQYDKITSYMDTFELSADDVAVAYDITAKLKHNPQLAFQALKPIWDELCARVGEVLPADLQARVQNGFLSADDAKELARARAATQTATQLANREVQLSQRGEVTRMGQAVQSAVARWDAQQVAKSADFVRLRPFVEGAARSIMAKEGMASTPDEAVLVLDRAFKQVTEGLQPLRPAASGPNGSTPRQPVAGAVTTAAAAPEPKSLREAAQLGLEGRYRPLQ